VIQTGLVAVSRQVHCSSGAWLRWSPTCSGRAPAARRGGERDLPNVASLSLNACAACTTTQFADVANASEVPARARFGMGANEAMRCMDRVVTLPARVDSVAGRNRQSGGSDPDSGYQVFAASRTCVLSAKVELQATDPFWQRAAQAQRPAKLVI
jgi:hypothetical protein